jgi:hypothetical protein
MPLRRLLFVLLVAAAALASAGGAAVAQDATPLVLRVAGSTRAMALGDAFVMGTRDSDAIFYNAAFFDAVRGSGIHVQRWGAGATNVTASAGGEWWGGTLAFGVRSLAFGMHMVQAAPLTMDERTLFQDGPVAIGQHAALLSYGRRVGGVRLAATGKYIADRRGSARRELAAFDLATGAIVGPVTLGVSVHDLDARLRLSSQGTHLPTRAAVRAATLAYPLGPLDVGLAAAVEQRLDVFRTTGGGGVEVSWWPIAGRTFTGRIGVRDHEPGGTPFTFGAGFTGDRIALDWAYRSVGEDAVTHRFGVRYR